MNPDAPHYVYRLYDAQDRLLYVGATCDVEERLFHLLHPCNQGKVQGLTAERVARRTATTYADRAAAFAAERAAIQLERPLLNRQSNPCGRRPYGLTHRPLTPNRIYPSRGGESRRPAHAA